MSETVDELHSEINRVLREIQNGNTSSVEIFFANHYIHWSTLFYEKTGDTVLQCAARNGLTQAVNYLLNNFQPKAVDCKNKDDKTALHEAAQFGQFEVCELLIKHGANVNALKRADWTPLMLACTKFSNDSQSRLKIVELLLDNGALINYSNKDGWTCLHLIAREGDVDILNLLIKYGVNIQTKTKNCRTALHVAALHGNLQVVNILLASGLNADERDTCGNTPLHEAILGNHIKVCKKLIACRADIHAKNNNDYGLIHLAANGKNLISIDFVINDLNCDINEINKNGITALHCAARANQMENYNFLIQHGAKQDIRDKFERTACDYLTS